MSHFTRLIEITVEKQLNSYMCMLLLLLKLNRQLMQTECLEMSETDIKISWLGQKRHIRINELDFITVYHFTTSS